LVGLLVLIAGIVVLFTGRYPRPLYEFTLGCHAVLTTPRNAGFRQHLVQ
jgi:hypothetical protein